MFFSKKSSKVRIVKLFTSARFVWQNPTSHSSKILIPDIYIHNNNSFMFCAFKLLCRRVEREKLKIFDILHVNVTLNIII